MNEPATEPQSTLLAPQDAGLLLDVAGRCRDGLTTTADAQVLEDLVRQAGANWEKQIQKLPV